mmetsp:Transcript_54482/g.121912  ORF Transcript_54482/g.121912 Transcript_54482/m.121912 type:complete len:92 (+) Transcript_54482:97-372(+)
MNLQERVLGLYLFATSQLNCLQQLPNMLLHLTMPTAQSVKWSPTSCCESKTASPHRSQTEVVCIRLPRSHTLELVQGATRTADDRKLALGL